MTPEERQALRIEVETFYRRRNRATKMWSLLYHGSLYLSPYNRSAAIFGSQDLTRMTRAVHNTDLPSPMSAAQETMPLKHTIISRISRSSLVDSFVYTARHGPAKGLKRRGGLGWLPSPKQSAEDRFLSELNWSGLTVYDIGGDQGLFSLFFARAVGSGRVIIFEPNPESCHRIKRNLELNQFYNAEVIQIGVAETGGTLQFTVPAKEPARGSAAPGLVDQIKAEGHSRTLEIEINSLDDEISDRHLPAPDFIKLDVEGMEYPALKGMKQTLSIHRPRLSVEIHGADVEAKASNARNVVQFLRALNYDLCHVESGQDITSENSSDAKSGHLYCVPHSQLLTTRHY